MKYKILLIFAFFFLLITGCNFFVEMSDDFYKSTAFCFKKEKINNDSLFKFVGKLVENNQNYNQMIIKSNFFDSTYSYKLFSNIFSKFLQECKENSYKIIDGYSFKIDDQRFDYYYGFIDYPSTKSIQGQNIKKIANIIIYPQNRKITENGDFHFTFFQRKDDTWYFWSMGFEYDIY